MTGRCQPENAERARGCHPERGECTGRCHPERGNAQDGVILSERSESKDLQFRSIITHPAAARYGAKGKPCSPCRRRRTASGRARREAASSIRSAGNSPRCRPSAAARRISPPPSVSRPKSRSARRVIPRSRSSVPAPPASMSRRTAGTAAPPPQASGSSETSRSSEDAASRRTSRAGSRRVRTSRILMTGSSTAAALIRRVKKKSKSVMPSSYGADRFCGRSFCGTEATVCCRGSVSGSCRAAGKVFLLFLQKTA